MFESSFSSSNRSSSQSSKALPKIHKPESPRLRASCDGCYLSKVRCTKETPGCSRCLNHGVLCKYSPSQRIGKPRRLRENHQARDRNKDPVTSTATSSESPSPCEVAPPPPLYSWNLHFDPSITAQRPAFDISEQMPPIWQREFPLGNCENETLMNDSCHIPGLPSPSKSLPTPVGYQVAEQSSSAVPALAENQMHHPQPHHSFSNKHMLLQDGLPELYSPPNYSPPLLADSFSPDICNCATTILDILQTLHHQPSNSTFDQVVAENQSATNAVSTILSCPCDRDSTSIMTLAVALTKIMTRYQSSRHSTTTDSTFHTLTSTPSASPVSTEFYKLRVDEEQVKLQVILSGLRIVDSLMARFQERFGVWPVMHEASVYGELITFLRKRLRDIVQELQRDHQTRY
ncbi:hypothetical protein MMC31_004438 [Peltigera leucophlebia]|nr:hypothetical protein [Peltigera leucophlebia]